MHNVKLVLTTGTAQNNLCSWLWQTASTSDTDRGAHQNYGSHGKHGLCSSLFCLRSKAGKNALYALLFSLHIHPLLFLTPLGRLKGTSANQMTACACILQRKVRNITPTQRNFFIKKVWVFEGCGIRFFQGL